MKLVVKGLRSGQRSVRCVFYSLEERRFMNGRIGGGVSFSNDGLCSCWICTIRHSKKGKKGTGGMGRDG